MIPEDVIEAMAAKLSLEPTALVTNNGRRLFRSIPGTKGQGKRRADSGFVYGGSWAVGLSASQICGNEPGWVQVLDFAPYDDGK